MNECINGFCITPLPGSPGIRVYEWWVCIAEPHSIMLKQDGRWCHSSAGSPSWQCLEAGDGMGLTWQLLPALASLEVLLLLLLSSLLFCLELFPGSRNQEPPSCTECWSFLNWEQSHAGLKMRPLAICSIVTCSKPPVQLQDGDSALFSAQAWWQPRLTLEGDRMREGCHTCSAAFPETVLSLLSIKNGAY